jgi:hypothetical protein
MYKEDLETLIELALADGVLTEKERSVLCKKAESFGIDIDEFEMVLDARLFKIQSKSESTTSKSQQVIVESVKISKLFELLTEADNTPREPMPKLEKEGGLLGMIIGQNGILGTIKGGKSEEQTMREIEHENKHIAKVVSKKLHIISSFPIPNRKEEILEFITLALPHANSIKKGMFKSLTPAEEQQNQFAAAWRSKCEQLLIKSRLTMQDDKIVLTQIESLFRQLN